MINQTIFFSKQGQTFYLKLLDFDLGILHMLWNIEEFFFLKEWNTALQHREPNTYLYL